MATVSLSHGDNHALDSRLMDLDSGTGTSRATRIAGWTLIIVVFGIMALWTQPLAHADYFRLNDSSLTVLTLPALRAPAPGVRLPVHLETSPAAAVGWLETTIASAAQAIPPATGDTVPIQNQALSISESFGPRITQDPTV